MNSITSVNQTMVGLWEGNGRDTICMVAESVSVLENQIVPIVPYGMIAMDAGYTLPFITYLLNNLFLV